MARQGWVRQWLPHGRVTDRSSWLQDESVSHIQVYFPLHLFHFSSYSEKELLLLSCLLSAMAGGGGQEQAMAASSHSASHAVDLGIACSLQGVSRRDGEGRHSPVHHYGWPLPRAHMKKQCRMTLFLQLKSSANVSLSLIHI